MKTVYRLYDRFFADRLLFIFPAMLNVLGAYVLVDVKRVFPAVCKSSSEPLYWAAVVMAWGGGMAFQYIVLKFFDGTLDKFAHELEQSFGGKRHAESRDN